MNLSKYTKKYKKHIFFAYSIFVYAFLFAIPDWYATNLTLPTDQNTAEESGTIKVSYLPKRGEIITFTNTSGIKKKLTCRTHYWGDHTCFVRLLDLDLDNKPVDVKWYKQKIFPFIDQNRIAELKIGNDTIMTTSDTTEHILRVRPEYQKDIYWILPLYLLTMIVAYKIEFKGKTK